MTFKQAFTVAALALGASTAAWAFDGQQLSKDASISLEQARAIALQAVPNATITDQELEHEQGGSGLRYSFELKSAGGAREIGVDARTGKLLADQAADND